jgi:KaiC/GvpD/RAD55 family RecA-like ATPase
MHINLLATLQRSHATVPLATGLPDLDHALRRGIPVGAISEFVGPAGVGGFLAVKDNLSDFCRRLEIR